MKINKLLTLAICSTMLIGCGKGKGKDPEPDYGYWPSQEISEFLDSFELSDIVIPGLKLESEPETEVVDTNFYLFVDDEGTPGVDSLEDAYVKVLESANWDINDSYYDDVGYIATEESELLSLVFCTFEGVFSLSICYYEPLEYGPWPSEKITSFLTEQGINDVTIPSLEGEFSFEILEDEDGEYVSIHADDPTNGMENTLKSALESANWEIDDSEYEEYGYFAVDSSEQVQIQFYSIDGQFVCFIYEYVGGGYEEEYFPWPVDEIDEWLASYELETTIPSMDIDVIAYFFDDTIYLYAEDNGTPGVDALEDIYCELLTAAGYVIDDSIYDVYGYIANDETGCLELSFYSYEGSFSLFINYSKPLVSGEWPSAEITNFLAENDINGIYIPKLDGEFSYKIDSDETGSYFYITAEDEGTIGVDSLEDSFAYLLGYYYWVIDDSEYEEYGYFAYDPLGQVEIQFFSYGGEFSLYISPLAPIEDDPNSWPINGITAYLENHGITDVTIPSLEGDFTGSIDFGSGTYVASCVDEGTPGVDSLEDSYLKLLQDAGWTIDDSKYESYGYFATDPSEQVKILFFSYNNEFIVFIHALEPKLYSVTTDDQGNTVITIDFTAFMSDQEVLGGLNIEGYLSFSASKGSGNNDPKYFANGEAVRLYWGNTLEFTPESGVTIASIEFNLTQSGNAFTSSTGSITTGTNKYTYTPNSGTGTQSLKVSGTSGNTRVSEIVITIAA